VKAFPAFPSCVQQESRFLAEASQSAGGVRVSEAITYHSKKYRASVGALKF
jgi:hypothetical protein